MNRFFSGALLTASIASTFACISISETCLAKPLAIVTSGGINIWSNHGRYYKNLDAADHVLSNWKIYNLAADGPGGQMPNSLNANQEDQIFYGSNGLPIPHRFEPKSNFFGPATYQAISQALEDGLHQLQPGDPVFFYFTDHGSRGDGPLGRKVCLWGEHLTVAQLRSLVDRVPETSRVIMVNDQCFGGGMLESLFQKGEARGNSCGFAAASTNQLAYGGGGMIRAIDTLCSKLKEKGRSCSFQDVYNAVIRSDSWKKNSTPVSSSDLFLEKVIKKPRLNDPRSGLMICGKKVTQASRSSFNFPVNEVLQKKISTLQKNLEKELGVLNPLFFNPEDVCEEISDELVAKVQKRVTQQEEYLRQLTERMNTQIKPRLRTEMVDGWLREQGNPELYTKYTHLQNTLSVLKKMRSTEADNSFDLESEIHKVQSELQPIEDEVNLYLAGIRDGDSDAPLATDFSRYLETKNAFHTLADAPASNILEEHNELERQISTQTRNLVPAWRFYRDLHAVRGLQILMEAGSHEEVSQYSNLLQCEQTSVL